MDRKIIAISGPTCSGKTALSVQLARSIDGEVINFDSVQIYREIQIATAKPTAEEMRGVPHHLIDYVDPNINYTAADWAADAAQKIAEIEERGKPPILVGGTGFYLRTLRRPLFDSPKTDQKLRDSLTDFGQVHGPEALHSRLAEIDPMTAAELEVKDSVRVIRALEYFYQTGRLISADKPKLPQPPEFSSRIRLYVLNPPRAELYQKINARTDSHFAAGLVEEVQMLITKGVRQDRNALGAHAYRRVCEYLRGERTLESAVERSKQDVRNYAKRQLTWFRGEPDAFWLNGFGEGPDIWAELRQNASEY